MDVDRGRLGTERHLATDFWMYEPAQKRSALKEQHQKSDLGNSRELSPWCAHPPSLSSTPKNTTLRCLRKTQRCVSNICPFSTAHLPFSPGTYQQGLLRLDVYDVSLLPPMFVCLRVELCHRPSSTTAGFRSLSMSDSRGAIQNLSCSSTLRYSLAASTRVTEPFFSRLISPLA